jgi:histidine triad (HIT) family protein
MPSSTANECRFCQIARAEVQARVVFEDDHSLAFLDHRPVFPGHTLLIPKAHYETLSDLPPHLLTPVFRSAQLLSRAIEKGLNADGSFVAMNNRVSQSVPHFHIHLVPRRKKDGLRGFFWPRHKYRDDEEAQQVQAALRKAMLELTSDG